METKILNEKKEKPEKPLEFEKYGFPPKYQELIEKCWKKEVSMTGICFYLLDENLMEGGNTTKRDLAIQINSSSQF